jgi:putative transcriptional regulator
MLAILNRGEIAMVKRKGTIVNRISVIAGQRRMRISDIAREAKISHQAAKRLWYGEAKRLDLDTLHGLCEALECQPGDLFVYNENSHGGQ